ncbi:hypothetical protein CsatA_028820 [Cannabis sativa]
MMETTSPLLADDDGHLLPKSPTASSPTMEATQLLPPQRRHIFSLTNGSNSDFMVSSWCFYDSGVDLSVPNHEGEVPFVFCYYLQYKSKYIGPGQYKRNKMGLDSKNVKFAVSQ